MVFTFFVHMFIVTYSVLRFVAEPCVARIATFLAVRNVIFDISCHVLFAEFSYWNDKKYPPFPPSWGGRDNALFTPRCVYQRAESDNAQLLVANICRLFEL
jgi:hypothetical protein